MRRAARTDTNHAEIVQALRQVGAEVLDLSRMGNGCPDLLVNFRGLMSLMEIKAETGEMTDDQLEFSLRWPFDVVRSVDEALRAIGASL